MNPFVFSLTVRQLLGRKTLISVGMALLPLLVAIVFRLSSPNINPDHWAATLLFEGLIVTAILPLTALLIGTSVLGDELEDGTALYLLTKPLPRWQILAPKLAAAILVTAALVLISTLASGLIALEGKSDLAILRGFAVGVVIGSAAYTTVFVMLSLITSRALIAGLVYVFIWEATIADVFVGTRYLSIRHYVLGISDWVSGVPVEVFEADISGWLALLLVAVTTVLAVILAEHQLEDVEIREST